MTAPTQYLRDLREQRTARRLEVAKALRDNPSVTNVELGKRFDVTRDTIALDRKNIMEDLRKNTVEQTEALRAEMVTKLEKLNTELELHRRDGKLPVSVIHEALLVHRTLIEMLGIRKPVIEKAEVTHKRFNFEVEIVPTSRRQPEFAEVVEVRNNRALGAGHEEP
jgi:hypothetical protein